MQEQSFVEKRAFTRFPLCIPATCFDPGLQEQVNMQTHDISAQGLGLITDKKLEPGTCLDLNLQMPDNAEKINRKARVVWIAVLDSKTNRVGIKLEEQKLNPIALVLRAINYQRKY